MKKVIRYQCDMCSKLHSTSNEAVNCERKHEIAKLVTLEFIAEVKKEYPDLNIQYEYNEHDDSYEIYHDDEKLEYENKEYSYFIGGLIKEILWDNDVFNVYMTGYRYEFK